MTKLALGQTAAGADVLFSASEDCSVRVWAAVGCQWACVRSWPGASASALACSPLGDGEPSQHAFENRSFLSSKCISMKKTKTNAFRT